MTLGMLTDSKSGCDIVALLNLSLLELAKNAAHGTIGLGLENFGPAEIAIAAEDFDGVARLEAVVGTDGDFDQLAARGVLDLAHDTTHAGHDGSRIGVGIDAIVVQQARLVADFLGKLRVAFPQRP